MTMMILNIISLVDTSTKVCNCLTMKNYKCKKIKVGQTMQEVEKQIKGVFKKKKVKHKLD